MRKIRASIAEGEQLETPIKTPCSAKAERRQQFEALTPEADVMSEPGEEILQAAGSGTSSVTTVQKCGSW